MNMSDAIADRRSVRDYKSQAISNRVLRKVLDSARLAPSAHNYQPWKLVVVSEEITRRSLSEACRIRWATDSGSKMMIQKWVAKPFGNAPILLVGCCLEKEAIITYHTGKEAVVCAKWNGFHHVAGSKRVNYHTTASCDLAIALDHITLAAIEEGLGTCWIGAFDEVEVKRVLSIPGEVRVVFLMSVGYPAAWPDARPRKPSEELISYEQYS